MSSNNSFENSRAVIFGLAGLSLTLDEKKFFKKTRPVGYILFKRNLENPKQVKSLVKELHKIAGWKCPILIDQEGGRVARLTPPHWRRPPAAGIFAALAKKNIKNAKRATYLNAQLIAAELSDLSINVDCAPMADILFKDSHNIIGDRAFGSDAKTVSILAGEMACGLIDGGVIPVLKHIPGHGRALLDSHESLPVVEASLPTLRKTDFVPFKNLKKLPWGMTAHITYTSIDKKDPATLSKKVIGIIRKEIGFDGLLLTDDLSMKALSGNFTQRCKKSIAAGCDILLHCNGKMEEMTQVASASPLLSKDAKKRLEKSLSSTKSKTKINKKKVLSELEKLIS